MRRADRLFQIVSLLQNRKLTTARFLAEKLEVSERTIYRDIQDLIGSGVQIEGEAGMGYVLKKGFDLPPLMFSREELEAILLAIRMAQSWTDPELAAFAGSALLKIEAVLPDSLRKVSSEVHVYAPGIHAYPTQLLKPLRNAIFQKQKIQIFYTDEEEKRSNRILRPLGLFFWGSVWTLVGWCELRKDFRNFRIDRILQLKKLDTVFEIEEGRSLQDYLSQFSDCE